MNKIELEKALQREGLMTVYVGGVEKCYIDGETLIENGIRQNEINVFGLYKGQQNYVVFITDDEKGLPYYLSRYNSEDDACDALYEKVTRLKRIHEKGML